MTSPLICVLKGPNGCGGVRIVMDFRCVNRLTDSDALAPPNITDVIQKVGRSNTTFDGKSSCWTIPIREKDQWLTGFVCEGQT